LNVVLVGEEGRAALSSIPPGAVVHAVGWYPANGETSRAIVCHTRGEHELAEIIAADQVIGGNPAIWGNAAFKAEELARYEAEGPMQTPFLAAAAPKRRGRPPKVK
jgi:hypothetical protein